MLRWYLGDSLFHRPERSGLPSDVRGAGAERFGLPSAIRGIPGVGWVSHCAASGAVNVIVMTAIAEACISGDLPRRVYRLARQPVSGAGDPKRNAPMPGSAQECAGIGLAMGAQGELANDDSRGD